MESSNGLPNSRTSTSKETKIPNTAPFPCIPTHYYSNNLSHDQVLGEGSNQSNPNSTPLEMTGLTKSNHHRCSSESFLQVEEKPSWLDDLLDEPDSPLYKGHRRSASDSCAYIDTMSLDMFNTRKESMFNNFSDEQQWDSSQSFGNLTDHSNIGSTFKATSSTTIHQKQERAAAGSSQNPKNLGENGEYSQSNTSASKAEVKHAKQKTAHRSRVRKLQYIAELERNVQVLQAEGSAVFAEVEFLDQNNLILSMENRALRQRLDSLSQEQLIKQMQHEMLERELGRLQALFQFQMQQQQKQQQQQQRKQQNAKNNRAKFKDLDSPFTNLSLSQNDQAGSNISDSANSFTRI